MRIIDFNRPAVAGNETRYITDVIESRRLSGNGDFTRKCHAWFEERLACKRALLTPSCTDALEMASILTDIGPGDEVIMPSYTFVSTANAFVLRGAKIVFVDIRPDTMNIDETLIENALTDKTRAIVPVHYAGVGCEMETILRIASENGLYVVEDAAQGMMATYRGRPLGTLGHLGTYSFHETKNYTSGGEGGLLIVNDQRFSERAEIIREKGTDRSLFLRGMVDKYTWVDKGSSFLPGELSAAYLYAQLEKAEEILEKRMRLWRIYRHSLSSLRDKGWIELPHIPAECNHNAHMFYIKTDSSKTRSRLIRHLRNRGIEAVFHYIPLHSSKAGQRFGRFSGEDRFTTRESERLLRLPLFYDLSEDGVERVCDEIKDFYVRNR
ncbi:dTDP-4-amino-4,6-dideoxygalactose transaminase [Hydrogenimonas sp. SS33]|uniref:dTDP-4-amino-4,6-dideoxygalactose transaminase n=1 Tax=Hydrogenimonas leucolamina TaxID=2954236 RepID=UPI00336BCF64